ALDVNIQLFEAGDQEALVLVLRVDEPVRKGAPARAQAAEVEVRGSSASGPEICCGEHQARFDHFVGDTELAVELQRPRLNRQRTRSGPWFGRFVDDADPDAEPGEPESEHQTGRAGADDEDFRVHTRSSEVGSRTSELHARERVLLPM